MGERDYESIARSVEMTPVRLFVTNSIAREAMHTLAVQGLIEFIDLNHKLSRFERPFSERITELSQLERLLIQLKTQLEQEQVTITPLDSSPNRDRLLESDEITELEEQIRKESQSLATLNESCSRQNQAVQNITQHLITLQQSGTFFKEASRAIPSADAASVDDDTAPLLGDVDLEGGTGQTGVQDHEAADAPVDSFIHVVAGTIETSMLPIMERVLWRTLRGNLYMNQSRDATEFIDFAKDTKVLKSVFVVFLHGEIAAIIPDLVKAMGANVYPVDRDRTVREERLGRVNEELEGLQKYFTKVNKERKARMKQIGTWLSLALYTIRKERLVHEALSRLKRPSYLLEDQTVAVSTSLYVGQGWCPTNKFYVADDALKRMPGVSSQVGTVLLKKWTSWRKKPTYIPTNKFTEVFQTIISAYGVPEYQEFNQGLPAIATFPFLFAVMFGDLGHAIILIITAMVMIRMERLLAKSNLDEMSRMLFSGRYLMLLMGLFSVFTGLIYNDIFSIPLSFMPSMWEWPSKFEAGDLVVATRKAGYTFPFGFDWSWHGANNDLLFANSLKMKLSVLLGWAHMTVSLCYSKKNSSFLKRPYDFWGNFVPGMIFFQAIFGYLVFTIVYKWSIDWVGRGEQPPGLLNMLIYMFLMPGTIEIPLFRGQAFVQVVLLVLAFSCVPVMLFLKPFWLSRLHSSSARQRYESLSTATQDSPLEDDGMIVDEEEEPKVFEYVEEQIHQVIHTIEFCLNCVSHTASYLRLWALSLAHQQLSIVLWNMTLKTTLYSSGIFRSIVTVFIFGGWFSGTVLVLCAMEGTSAMLHSLRLHWVEAMSKHFHGEGIEFQPVSVKAMLENDPI